MEGLADIAHSSWDATYLKRRGEVQTSNFKKRWMTLRAISSGPNPRPQHLLPVGRLLTRAPRRGIPLDAQRGQI